MDKTHKRIFIGISLIILVTAGIMIPLALMSQPVQVELEELAEYDAEWGMAVIVEEDIAYVLDTDDSSPRGLVIIDVSDPSNPVELGSFRDDGFPMKLDVEGEFVYMADTLGSLRIINVSDPTNPEQVGEYTGSGEIYDVQVIGNIAYVADYGLGLILIDVRDPRNPTFITSWGNGRNGRDVVVVGD